MPAYFTAHRAVIIVTAILFMSASWLPGGQVADRQFYRFATWLMPHEIQPRHVTVIAITDKDLKQYGAWPWSRRYLATVIRKINNHNPGAIGLLLPLHTSQTPAALEQLDSSTITDKQAQRALNNWKKRLDTDRVLSTVINNAGNVILAVPLSRWHSVSQEQLKTSALPALPASEPGLLEFFRMPPQQAWRLTRLPLPLFLEAARGNGLLYRHNSNEFAFSGPLLHAEGDRVYPSFAYQLATLSRHRRTIESSTRAYSAKQVYPLPQQADKRLPIRQYTIDDLINNRIPPAALRSKAVIVGLQTSHTPMLTVTGGLQASPLVWQALLTSTILTNRSIKHPDWYHAGQRGAILALMLLLLLLPGAARSKTLLVTTALLLTAMINLNLIVLLTNHLWLPLGLPSLYLAAILVYLAIRYSSSRHTTQLQMQANTALLELGNHLKNQGQLDRAFENYSECSRNPAVAMALYQLGLEYERRRQLSKAVDSYRHIQSWYHHFEDVDDRIGKLSKLTAPGAPVLNVNPAATIVVDDPELENPCIGRFTVERELGRGAMGMVYLGIDPEIERHVAIKTMPAGDDSEKAAEARERFRREATAAGRLEHPNIVTIYDVGEEHDLAYIAMDYAPGQSLDHFTTPGNLLEVDEVLEIAAQTADALAYAHSKKVVHRDIKPHNIIYNPSDRSIKITDFGVAALLDESLTRTGTVLGSPMYMSPEQVAGKKLDGRSDLYSLGVTIYQLLTGAVPFSGDSLPTLMHKIIHDKHKGIGSIRKGLPGCTSRIVNKALQKECDKRFQDGLEMKQALERCLKKVL